MSPNCLKASSVGARMVRGLPISFLLLKTYSICVSLSKLQKQLLESALKILKVDGKLVYSTCTHAPEENEEVLDYLLKKYPKSIKIEKISLPIIPRTGILKWQDKEYLEELQNSCRVYPQDNNTEGFFLAKIKKLKEKDENPQ